MNVELSEYLINAFQGANHLDRIAGVVQTVTVNEKKLPAGFPYKGGKCGLTREAIIPESKYKGVVFFEDKGIVPTRNLTRVFGFRSDLRLICWLNNKKLRISTNSHRPDTFAILDLTQSFQAKLPYSEIFLNTKVTVSGITVQDESIFSKYDFDDKTSAYLQPENYYFAMDLSITFYVPKTCPLTISLIEGTC